MVNESLYGVYIHIRDDNGTVFYVGMSRVVEVRSISAYGRTKGWKAIVAKTTYSVVICEKNMSKADAQAKERELIKKYGRVSHGGTLVNVTQGNGLNKHTFDVTIKLSGERGALLCDILRKKMESGSYKNFSHAIEALIIEYGKKCATAIQ